MLFCLCPLFCHFSQHIFTFARSSSVCPPSHLLSGTVYSARITATSAITSSEQLCLSTPALAPRLDGLSLSHPATS